MTPYPDSVHVVSHTHWDREWYKSAESFRIGLISVVDALLDRDDDAPFLLDGQAIVLDDYLSWKPERRAEVARDLISGRLEAGPWYVLADNVMPGAEALVRNLLAGRSSLRFLRAASPPVLYCPDSFGHPAAAPLLARGFGLDMAIVWRGFGGRLWPAGDTVRWRHPSGAEVLLYHLPPSGYEFGASLPGDDAGALARWKEIERVQGQRSRTGLLLLLNGADHHARQPDAVAAIHALGRAAAPATVAASSLREFSAALLSRTSAERLGEVTGELRASPDYTWSLQGTPGVRAQLKRRNAEIERLLVREVEPWLALSSWNGRESHIHALHAIWRMVLACHPHDTLCGCSTDDVALAVQERLRAARNAAMELRSRTLRSAISHERGEPVLLLTNPVPRPRGGVVEVALDDVLSRVPVGPGSASSLSSPSSAALLPVKGIQSLRVERTFVRDEDPLRYPRNYLVERNRALIWLPKLPPMGIVTSTKSSAPALPASGVRARASRARIRNGACEVWVDEQQRLCIEHGDRMIVGALRFESEGERGDLYTHSPIPGTHRRGVISRRRVTLRGPLRSGILTTHTLEVAEREVELATGEVIRRPRQKLALGAEVQLDAGSSWVRVVVSGNNSAPDHRLRIVFETGVSCAVHVADGAFGRVARSSALLLPLPDDVETIPRTAPLHRYVTLFDPISGRGATIFSDGLSEYEAAEDGSVAITLQRAVGELSRGSLPERPGHAGWPVATPMAQSQGPFEAVFAIMLHGPLTNDTISAIEEAADDFLLPITGETVPYSAIPARETRGLELSGRGLRFECCKQAEDGSGALVVRCTNLVDAVTRGTWTLPGLKSAQLCRLDETSLGALAVRDNAVAFEAQPFAVVSLLLSPRGA